MKFNPKQAFMAAALAATCLPAESATITSAVLEGPSKIYCCPGIGGSANYTLTIGVTGAPQPTDTFWHWGIFDEDLFTFTADTLISFQPIPLVDDVFTMVLNFTLTCDASCNITGSGGTSGETTAEVYGFVKGIGPLLGVGTPVKSNVLSVECVTLPTPCPEAATMLPSVLFLTGCSLVRRRGKRKA